MPGHEDRPRDDRWRDLARADVGAGQFETLERAATLVLHVWREGEGRDCQLKARLVAQVRAGAAGPEHVDRQYALGIDGVLARIRAWLVAFSSDQ